MSKVSAFEVTRYGKLLDIYDVTVQTRFITQKVYEYEGNLFIETWCDGIRLSFTELFD